MHKEAINHMRTLIKDEVSKLPEGNQTLFKTCFGRKTTLAGTPTRTVEQAHSTAMDQIVDEIPESNLGTALDLIRRTAR